MDAPTALIAITPTITFNIGMGLAKIRIFAIKVEGDGMEEGDG
jgi:hypothetical protein